MEYDNPAEAFYARPVARDGLNTTCKVCKRAQFKLNYTRHRAERIAKVKLYAAEHREQRQANMKAWHERNKHRPRLDRQTPEYREYAKAKSKEWYQANKELAIQRQRIHNKIRDARRRAAEGKLIAADIRQQYKAQDGKCYWCDTDLPANSYHVDHVMPLAKGGNNTPSNIVVACGPCNLSKNHKHPADFNRERWERFQTLRMA